MTEGQQGAATRGVPYPHAPRFWCVAGQVAFQFERLSHTGLQALPQGGSPCPPESPSAGPHTAPTEPRFSVGGQELCGSRRGLDQHKAALLSWGACPAPHRPCTDADGGRGDGVASTWAVARRRPRPGWAGTGAAGPCGPGPTRAGAAPGLETSPGSEQAAGAERPRPAARRARGSGFDSSPGRGAKCGGLLGSSVAAWAFLH